MNNDIGDHKIDLNNPTFWRAEGTSAKRQVNPIRSKGNMKHKSFEDFLMDYHCRIFGDSPYEYGAWLQDLNSGERIALGDMYLKEQIG